MARLVGVGDNVVDMNYTVNVVYPGGNSVNFAVYGRQLGFDTAYVGMIADDRWGKKILSVLKKKGVDVSHAVIATGETGICAIRLTNGDRTITVENDYGLVKKKPLVITKKMLSFIKKFDIAHSSCYSFIETELHKIKNAGVPVLYDFSDEWDEHVLAEVCPEISFAFFSGKKLPVRKLKEYLRMCVDQYGCRMAITTIGGRGAIVYNGRKYYTKKPYNYQGGVIDTTGAGDSWITAFISSYIDRMKELDIYGFTQYILQNNIDDYEDHVIEESMCKGNLLARKNCQVRGSFEMGETIK